MWIKQWRLLTHVFSLALLHPRVISVLVPVSRWRSTGRRPSHVSRSRLVDKVFVSVGAFKFDDFRVNLALFIIIFMCFYTYFLYIS